MKKFLSIILMMILSITAVFSLVACDNGGGGTPETGIICKKNTDGYVVTGYVDEGKGVTELDVETATKAKYGNSAKVVRIKAGAFDGNSTLVSVVVPTTVTKIDGGAFKNMKSLVRLTIPFVGYTNVADSYDGENKVAENKSIGEQRSFGYIFGTQEYTGGSQMTFNYTKTKTLTAYLPATLREVIVNPAENYNLPAYAFSGLAIVPTLTLGEKVISIGEASFYKTFSVETLTLGEGIVNVYKDAFTEFTSLKTINYKGSLNLSEYGISSDVTIKNN